MSMNWISYVNTEKPAFFVKPYCTTLRMHSVQINSLPQKLGTFVSTHYINIYSSEPSQLTQSCALGHPNFCKSCPVLMPIKRIRLYHLKCKGCVRNIIKISHTHTQILSTHVPVWCKDVGNDSTCLRCVF